MRLNEVGPLKCHFYVCFTTSNVFERHKLLYLGRGTELGYVASNNMPHAYYGTDAIFHDYHLYARGDMQAQAFT